MFRRTHLLFVFMFFIIGGIWIVSLPSSTTALSLSRAEAPIEQFLTKEGTFRAPTDFVGSINPAGYNLISGPGESPRFSRIAQNTPQSPLAGIDNVNWSPTFGVPGANGSVRSMLWTGTDLYVGGTFTSIGGVSANRIARWDGSTWSALGTGTNNSVLALAWDGTNLYAGGTFSTPGSRVARWDGANWNSLGTGMNAGSIVFALTLQGGNLYAGGNFTTAGGGAANRIAQWNGTTWSALGTGFSNGAVRALTSDGTNLYAGGTFTAPISRIASWNGATWSALGSGVDNNVFALAWTGSTLYVGGTFLNAGGAPANRIAEWNGTAWSALGTGVDDTVNALNWSGSELFVGGAFVNAGGSPANRIARWNGSSWGALGSGTNVAVFALAWDNISMLYDNLYVGGDFTTAGLNASNFVADLRIAAIWDGGGVDNNGSTAANWSGDVVPTASDVAIFDITSNKDATLDGAFTPTLGGLLIEDSYTGTITQNNGLAITSDLLAHGGTLIVADPSVFSLTVSGVVINTGAVFQQTRPVNSADVPFLEISDGGSNVKYRGAEINTTGTGANLGGVTVRIRVIDTTAGEYCTQQGPNSYLYNRRCYEITATTDGAANLQLWYLFTERAGGSANQMGIFRDTTGNGGWVLLNNRTTGSGDSGAYRFATGDTPGFSHFLTANAGYAPTAVTLQTFSTTSAVTPVFLVLVGILFISATFVIWQRRKA